MSLLLLFKSSAAPATDGGSRSYFGWWLGGFAGFTSGAVTLVRRTIYNRTGSRGME
jgi:hypothetical protein